MRHMRQSLPYDRSERVADAIRKLVSEMLLRDISDPRLQDAHVTQVRMTKDLRIARIYFHALGIGSEERSAMEKGFLSAAGFLRRRIGKELGLKFTPEVEFYYDESIELGERIEELLSGVRGESGDE